MQAVSVQAMVLIYKPNIKGTLKIALPFALFQGLMTIIGYFCAELLPYQILEYNYFIVFLILAFLGVKMMYEAVCHEDERDKGTDKELTASTTFAQVIATSIDALVVGIMISQQSVEFLLVSSLVIVTITFIMCSLAVWIGKEIGTRLNSKAEAVGGVLLIILAVKVLIDSV